MQARVEGWGGGISGAMDIARRYSKIRSGNKIFVVVRTIIPPTRHDAVGAWKDCGTRGYAHTITSVPPCAVLEPPPHPQTHVRSALHARFQPSESTGFSCRSNTFYYYKKKNYSQHEKKTRLPISDSCGHIFPLSYHQIVDQSCCLGLGLNVVQLALCRALDANLCLSHAFPSATRTPMHDQG